MAKDLIEDIKWPKRSLQEVLPASPSVRQGGPASRLGEPTSPKLQRGESVPKKSRSSRRWVFISLIVLILIFVLVYFGSTVFGRALVSVTPRRIDVPISGIYRTVKLPSASGTGAVASTTLGFQTMTIRESDSVTIPAGESVAVSERATGTIIITNRHSQTAERLIANTRFETPTGKIYRIRESVLVPGYTLVGGTLTPGELTVKVTADQPGESYNGTLSTFVIPGFKGGSRFNTITARASTPFTGGFVGRQKAVSPSTRLNAEAELTDRLKQRLLAEAPSQVPTGHVWYPKSVFWRLGESKVVEEAGGGSTVKLTRQIELVAPIFSQLELNQELARRFVTAYDGASISVTNLALLDLVPIAPPTDLEQINEFIFTLTGEGIFTWQFDSVALTSDLAGRRARDYQAVFIKYPSIVASHTTFTPPWLIRFPRDAKRIDLLIDKTDLTVPTPSDRISDTINQPDTPNGN